jgi:hypothetical protein
MQQHCDIADKPAVLVSSAARKGYEWANSHQEQQMG